ncbi:MAG TPA: hypothetical protein VM030_09260 [Acidimicrobiales bacterium]|nr:hypothetical protein [Acidimicrobiales bacterium]
MLFAIIGLIVGGIIIGALGRLAVPGPNPMSLPMTCAVGIGGSLIGGLIGRALFGSGGFFLSVLVAALIVWLVARSQQGNAARR